MIVGIDLGTTYSCVGVHKHGKVEMIANDQVSCLFVCLGMFQLILFAVCVDVFHFQGNRITPSYVAWTDEGERLIGDSANNQATINPENTVFGVKRLIGRKFSDKSV